MEIIKKNIKQLPIITTTHGVGEKRVLLNNQETSTPLTQIAVTRLKAGEMAKRTLASYHGRILSVSKKEMR